MVDSYASLDLPELPKADQRHIAQCIRFAMAMMPRKGSDHLSGEVMTAGYTRILSDQPKEAVSYAFDRATRELDWFPTPKQLLAFCAAWERDDEAWAVRGKARALSRQEHQARFEDAVVALRRGDVDDVQLNGWPERWLAIAETRGLIWQIDDIYRVRPTAVDRIEPEEEANAA